MDIDALANRLKGLEDKVGNLSPELLIEFKQLFEDVKPALAQAEELLARVKNAEEAIARLTDQLANGVHEVSERVSALELVVTGETKAPDELPPAVADVEPAPDAELVTEGDGQGAPQE